MAKGAYIGIDNVARKIKKGYIGISNFEKRNLPEDYTQVEYIQSSGTQYIDTGFIANHNTRVIMDFEVTGSASELHTMFGTRVSATERAYAFLWNKTLFRSYYNDIYDHEWRIDLAGRRIVDKNKETTTFDGQTYSFEEKSFTTPASLKLMASDNNGTIEWYMVGRVYSCQIYDNDVLVRDYVPCANASGTAGLYDLVNDKFYGNAGSGTFAKGAKQSSIAHKIKKAYIGIGGVARPCWGGGELVRYGNATPLPVPANNLIGVSVGNYALIAGGYNETAWTHVKTVTTYNANLVRGTAPEMTSNHMSGATASVGNYGLLAAGGTNTASSIHYGVDAYSNNLVKSNPTGLSSKRSFLAGASNASYALFAGGKSGTNELNRVESYSASLVKGTATELSSTSSAYLAGARVGNYALFAGGVYLSTSSLKVVDAYNNNLVKSRITDLSTGRYQLVGESVGNYALFAGGCSCNLEGSITSLYNTVDAYNSDLVHTTATSLSAQRYDLMHAGVEGFAVFAGGKKDTNNNASAAVDSYNADLVRSNPSSLSAARIEGAYASTGNYALFAGGQSSNKLYDTVDAYTVA